MMKKIAITLITLFCTALTALAGQGGMYYKDFHVEAVVHANNVWDVTETITVNFLEPRHGIYRYISYDLFIDQDVKNVKGEVEQKRLQYRTDIDFVSVEGSEYSTDYDDSNVMFKLGSPDYTVTGLKTYVLKYRISYPYDRNVDTDFLFHTVLPADLEDEVKHFSFVVTFDKPIAQYATSKLQVYSGAWGNKDNSLNVKVSEDGNTISGEVSDVPARSGVTLYQKLKNGFYEGKGLEPNSPKPMQVCFYISLALLVLIGIQLIFVTRPHVTKQIEFYPPEGISSAEVGTIIDESVDDIDIASLIPWFASKGYLTIREVSEERGKKFTKKTKLELKRIKGLPSDAPKYQKTFFDVLFAKGNTCVRLDKLEEQPEKMKEVHDQINNLYKGTEGDENDKSLSHTRLAYWLYLPLIITTTFAFLFSYPGSYCDVGLLLAIIFAWTTPFALGWFANLIFANSRYVDSTTSKVVVFIIKLVLFCIATITLAIFLFEEDSFMTESTFLITSILCFAITEFAGNFHIETPYRAQMMGKLLGLKEFIETAEKPRLESLLEDDPQYFYRLLPYALVFGISDKWAEQFKDIKMEKPSWYSGSSNLDSYMFSHTMANNLCSSTSSAITTVSHDSSSISSSGGGGFSGGGGGGGGGGSW